MRVLWVVVAMLAGPLSVVSLAAEVSSIGRKIDAFKLKDFRGAEHDASKWNSSDFVVVAFLGTECPLAKMYGPRLAELANRYDGKKIDFVAIDSNEQDTLVEMAQYARVSKIEFPFLKDPSNLVADLFGAKRTPEVFVLDRDRTVRYHGRIDDQFGVGYSRNEPKRQDLAIALDELISGRDVSTTATTATGCQIGRVHRGTPHGDITYAQNISKIIQDHCIVCHRSGEIGPFSLESAEDVKNWSATIREVVQEQRMPPWHANSDAGRFVNDRRLSDHEKKLLFDWIDNGMPIGDISKQPKPLKFVEGWQIPHPDLVLDIGEPYKVPAKGTVEYQYFPIKATFDEDQWVVAAEARPGNRAVVHHLILFYVPPNFDRRVEEASLKNSIASFAPGLPAWTAAPGTARRIPAGSKLYVQAHYTPNGAETTDLSRVGLVFADAGQVEKQLLTDALVNFRLQIPPHQDNVLFKGEFSFGRDMRLISMLPHMHLRGKAFRIESLAANGDRHLLLDVPRYDFNWQNNYVFAEPLLMKSGSKLLCSAWYDNSEKNPSNPDPTQTVTWGDQTWQEMFVAQFEMVVDEQDLRLGRPQVRPVEDGEYEVEFSYRPTVKAEAVYLAGVFNEWKPNDLKMDGPDAEGRYVIKQHLKAGTYEYKFVVDGKDWHGDPGNPDVTGFYSNSVLKIPAPTSPKSN